MAKSSRAEGPIDRLLQERQQYTVWLARLDSTADTAPPSVRQKIRGDYQARLDAVLEQLRGHADDLAGQLTRQRETRGDLLTREEQAKEILAEAEIRHAVGEYDDAKWQEIRGEAQRNLVAVREELATINGEIEELEKVQAMIATPPAPEPSAPAPEPPPPAAEAAAPAATAPNASAPAAAPAGGTEPARPRQTDELAEFSKAFDEVVSGGPKPESGPPRPAEPAAAADAGQTTVRPPLSPRPAKPGSPPGRTLWFPSGKNPPGGGDVDELAFLKSVSEDETTGPSPRRASGGSPRPAEALGQSAPANPPAPPPVTTTQHTLEASGPHEIAGRPSVPTAQRTLKCGECGTMNRPTEWYCERCGAELADL